MKKSILFCFAAVLFLQMFSACKKEPQTSVNMNTQKMQSKKTEAASESTEEPLQFDESYADQFADMEEDDFFAVLSPTSTGSDGIDLDFTKINYVMASGIIFDMLMNQNDYLGKKIKIKGAFWADQSEPEPFLAVLLYDETACCQTGLTFKDVRRHYPEDYPELLSEIEITGVYTKEEKDGIIYTYIDCRNSQL